MALSLNGLEPVEFEGRACTPVINTELKLRLTQITEYNEAADLVLASAFPNDEEYVRNFLQKAPVVEKEILHAYLVGGERAAKAAIDGLEDGVKKAIDKALESAGSK